VDDALTNQARVWFSEVFHDTEQMDSFMNSVAIEPAQVVSTHFALVSPNAWRILLVCWLTPEQDFLRRQWQATEATLRGRRSEVVVGGAH